MDVRGIGSTSSENVDAELNVPRKVSWETWERVDVRHSTILPTCTWNGLDYISWASTGKDAAASFEAVLRAAPTKHERISLLHRSIARWSREDLAYSGYFQERSLV